MGPGSIADASSGERVARARTSRLRPAHRKLTAERRDELPCSGSVGGAGSLPVSRRERAWPERRLSIGQRGLGLDGAEPGPRPGGSYLGFARRRGTRRCRRGRWRPPRSGSGSVRWVRVSSAGSPGSRSSGADRGSGRRWPCAGSCCVGAGGWGRGVARLNRRQVVLLGCGGGYRVAADSVVHCPGWARGRAARGS
jgi:hypothetical protein